jgi:hypothetical protein
LRGENRDLLSAGATVARPDYLDAHNDEPKPFRWTKTADEILASIARFATRTSTAHPGPAF